MSGAVSASSPGARRLPTRRGTPTGARGDASAAIDSNLKQGAMEVLGVPVIWCTRTMIEPAGVLCGTLACSVLMMYL
jgi:hypothetical protein